MNPLGTTLGRILHRAPITAYLAFGGADWNTLNVTHRHLLDFGHVKIPGRLVLAAGRDDGGAARLQLGYGPVADGQGGVLMRAVYCTAQWW